MPQLDVAALRQAVRPKRYLPLLPPENSPETSRAPNPWRCTASPEQTNPLWITDFN
jgi:hypothetical protein